LQHQRGQFHNREELITATTVIWNIVVTYLLNLVMRSQQESKWHEYE
jgi:hypothetical protein